MHNPFNNIDPHYSNSSDNAYDLFIDGQRVDGDYTIGNIAKVINDNYQPDCTITLRPFNFYGQERKWEEPNKAKDYHNIKYLFAERDVELISSWNGTVRHYVKIHLISID